MNICLLASGFLPKVGGLEIAVNNLATALHRCGHRVVVVAPKSPGALPQDACPFPVVTFGFRGSSRFRLTSLLAVAALFRVVRRYGIEVVHVHDVFAPGTWARLFKRLRPDIPIIGTPHGEDINVVPALKYGRRLDAAADAVIRQNIAHFDMVTAISQSVHDELAAIVHDEGRIRDIPNGIWTETFQVPVDRSAVRRRYGIPEDAVAILSVGRNAPVKRLTLGLRAVAGVITAGYNVVYILIGRNMESIQVEADELGIGEKVYTLEQLPQPKVIEWYLSADIYLNTSQMESFGLTTLEAMSAGLACVVTDVPGNRDVVSAQWGAVVPGSSADALTAAICRLVESAPRRVSMGHAAQQAAKDFDWPRIADAYLASYRELAG